MDWAPGAGTGTGAGSPEAARGADALRDRRPRPPVDEEPPRPGCLRATLTTIAVLLATGLIVYLIAQVISRVN